MIAMNFKRYLIPKTVRNLCVKLDINSSAISPWLSCYQFFSSSVIVIVAAHSLKNLAQTWNQTLDKNYQRKVSYMISDLSISPVNFPEVYKKPLIPLDGDPLRFLQVILKCIASMISTFHRTIHLITKFNIDRFWANHKRGGPFR